eukprot:1669511-Prymnesium_polylepis.1
MVRSNWVCDHHVAGQQTANSRARLCLCGCGGGVKRRMITAQMVGVYYGSAIACVGNVQGYAQHPCVQCGRAASSRLHSETLRPT